MEEMHFEALGEFSKRTGYVQDREHVVGFEPHGFSRRPSLRAWQVQRVELVSLLKHDTPVVYVSDFLPKMDELKSAAVRPLDSFERQSLTKLRMGEDVVEETSHQRILMLGAIRAATQCVRCHSVERNTLLGAFSYELLPDGQPTVEKPVVEPAL